MKQIKLRPIAIKHRQASATQARIYPQYPSFVWYFLHQQAIIEISDQTSLIFGYPIIPWIGLMAIGYILGSLYTDYQAKERKTLLMKYGLYSIGAFLILRLTNFYGEPNPFIIHDSITYSIN